MVAIPAASFEDEVFSSLLSGGKTDKYVKQIDKIIEQKVKPMVKELGKTFIAYKLSRSEFKVMRQFDQLSEASSPDPMVVLSALGKLNKVIKPLLLLNAMEKLGRIDGAKLTADYQASSSSCGGGNIIGTWN